MLVNGKELAMSEYVCDVIYISVRLILSLSS